MMTLRHLEIFRAVVETGSFTKAAEKLYITQSAVSHAIRELEDQAKTLLFDRLSRKVQLTKSGQLFFMEMTPLLTSFENFETHIPNLEKQAPLHIVSSITIAAFWLPNLLNKFAIEWPELSITVEVVSAAHAVEVLESGKADLALIEGSHPQGPFTCISFANYPMQIVCAPDYPLKNKILSISEFCTEKLLLREKGSAIRDTLDSALYLAGETVHPIWTSVNSTALIEAAKAGLGITILPDVLVKEALENHTLITIAVADLILKNELLAVYHKEKYLTASMKSLCSLIKSLHNDSNLN